MPKLESTASHESNTPVLRLAVPSPLRRLFDYLPPKQLSGEQIKELKIGVRVEVPFGSRKLVAILVSIETDSPVPAHKLRHATRIIDTIPVLSDSLMRLYRWATQYYQHPPGEVFQHMVPSLLRQGVEAKRELPQAWRLSETGAQLNEESLKRAPRQREVIDFLREHTLLLKQESSELGLSANAITTLNKQGHIELVSVEQSQPSLPSGAEAQLELNEEQAQALEQIQASASRYNCFLLDGVTGSGKTEVYLQAIAETLAAGKQALVLVPEISLTPQTIARFRRRFSCHFALLHSGLSDRERLQSWAQARDGIASIIIGTRSALFTPMAKPGIIILDEEHDGSFKQQDGFRYSARDMAVMRANYENIPVILGSATPALESLNNALNGRFTHLSLSKRAGPAAKAKLSLLDTSNQTLQEGFSPALLDAIAKHLNDGNQVMVFINRRGFSPTLQCNACGWVSECQHCDARMTLHKNPAHIRCHHCDSRSAIPRHCPECQKHELIPLGLGTERSEHLLTRLFPDTNILRIDRDSTRRKNSLDAMLDTVHQGEPCILIGTQMLAKGHHFPDVTLVAVLDADSGLFSADFRGQEHTAQLLMQVAGRAGRATKPGEVLIQTRHADHETLQTLTKSGYKDFALSVLQERRAANMPPFSHLALLRAEAPAYAAAERFLLIARELITQALDSSGQNAIQIMGPMPAPMERRANKYRAQLLLQSNERKPLQQLLAQLCPQLESLKEARQARWSIDIDPQDMI
ncbi:MAG: primosomal protein N' [Pseudohongiellaceae bacterium]|nr:primosomal protein N' [Pseudohongiellaceae bacterium]